MVGGGQGWEGAVNVAIQWPLKGLLGPTPIASDSVALESENSTKKFLVAAAAAGLGTTLWEPVG